MNAGHRSRYASGLARAAMRGALAVATGAAAWLPISDARADPAPLMVAPSARDAELALRTGYRYAVKISIPGRPDEQRTLSARPNERVSLEIGGERPWRLTLAAASIGGGRLRIDLGIESGTPLALVSEPALVLAEGVAGSVEVGDGSGKAYALRAEVSATSMQVDERREDPDVKRLSPPIKRTPARPVDEDERPLAAGMGTGP